MREKLAEIVESKVMNIIIMAAIILNAILIVVESYVTLDAPQDIALFETADRILVTLFILEIVARMVAHGRSWFKDPWHIFDFIVTVPALLPGLNSLSVARILRILRLLRLLSAFKPLRLLTTAMMQSVLDTMSIAAVTALIMFIFSALSYRLFGEVAPEQFGTIGAAMFTLFKVAAVFDLLSVLTAFDGMKIIAYPFFITYFVVMIYFVLNFFIGVASYNVSNIMEELYENRSKRSVDGNDGDEDADHIKAELAEVKAILASLLAQKNETAPAE